MNIARDYEVEAHVILANLAIRHGQYKNESTDYTENLANTALKNANCLVGIQVRERANFGWEDEEVKSETVSILRDYLKEHPDIDPENVRLTVIYVAGDEEE